MADLMEQHLAGILAYWKWGLTKAFMEGLNSVFSATKRKARGYPSTTYLITMLYFTACKLRFPPILIPSQTAGNLKTEADKLDRSGLRAMQKKFMRINLNQIHCDCFAVGGVDVFGVVRQGLARTHGRLRFGHGPKSC